MSRITLSDEQFDSEFDSKLMIKSTNIPSDVLKLEGKSAKMRALNSLGWTRGQIAKALTQLYYPGGVDPVTKLPKEVRYQHVKNVLDASLKKQQH